MTASDIPMLAASLDALADTFDKRRPTKEAVKVWFDALRNQRTEFVMDALNAWAGKFSKMPFPADVLRDCSDREQRESSARALSTPRVDRFIAEAGVSTPRIEECRSHMRELVNLPRKPGKEWAKRLLDKHSAGEYVLPLALNYALQVSGDGPAPYPTRVPGEDDE